MRDPHIGIILTRLEALRAAIVVRDWTKTEWEYDRVLRATTKALEAAVSSPKEAG